MLKTNYTFTLEDYKRAFAKTFFWVKSINPKIFKPGVFWYLLLVSFLVAIIITILLSSTILSSHVFISSTNIDQIIVDIINSLFRITIAILHMVFWTVIPFLIYYLLFKSRTRKVALKQVINRKHEMTLDEFQITVETDIIKIKFKKEDVRAIKLDKDFLYIFTKFLGVRVIPTRAITQKMKEFLEKNWKF